MSQVRTSSLLRVGEEIKSIVDRHFFKPDFGYGPTSDINAGNQLTMPFVWLEPYQSRIINSIQGITVEKLTLNIYAMDRINKGDDNFAQIHSDMLYLLQTIMAEIRQSQTFIDLFIRIETEDQVFTPVTRDTDEYCNGWMVKLVLRMPMTYNPCNIPISNP